MKIMRLHADEVMDRAIRRRKTTSTLTTPDDAAGVREGEEEL